jgi:8-oxo-dGTP diphosphatase
VTTKAPEFAGDEPGCLGIETHRPPHPLPIVLVAAVALVDIDNRVLVQQRPAHKSWAGWWEFPGGKVHDGETPEATIVRELKEELGLDITESCLAPFTFTSYAYDDFHLLMPLYLCRVWKGTPVPQEGQTLKWVRPMELGRLPQLLPADAPLVAMLRDWL